ncbi:MAG: Glyceraldehyde-3-phosphate dehydrogenase/erythrose-4-phosphate dehydrogenase [Bacteroidetes bacterium]|jgi:glyceraldehyde 3-phosphate dehydrogenase|nr:Glyceraldehyde-3-phosphate dehydrogenase/erythrose-4-phosphate dehydrogenase [Bacteroidota bacterium]
MKKIRVGINGFGRIGRAICRINQEKKLFDIVAINDINPDIGNIAYTLNYDSLYDSLKDQFHIDGDCIANNSGEKMKVFHCDSITGPDWQSLNIDFVIDASGILKNVIAAQELITSKKVKKVFVTHSPEPVDFTLVLGANETELDVNKHHVISTSICDATAIAPVLKIVNTSFGIENGYVTTLHPWLNYQNLLDGSASSWSVPGEVYHHYALGRSSVSTMIPKPTTAVSAACKVLKAENITEEIIGSLSFRTPTHIVGSADITLFLKKDTDTKTALEVFTNYQKQQKWNILHNNMAPLISSDFKKSEYSAIVDNRWTQVMNKRMLKLVLWYDNEWGYSSSVLREMVFVAEKMGMM